MKNLITLLVALSLVSPAIYADHTSKKNKAKQTTHHLVLKKNKQHIAKNKTFTPITKKMLQAGLAKNENKHKLKPKTIATNHPTSKLHKSKTIVANRPANVEKKPNLPAEVQTQESAQLGLNTNENGLDANQTIPQDKGFFRNVWDQFISFFR